LKITREQERVLINHMGSLEKLIRTHRNDEENTVLDDLRTDQLIDAYLGYYTIKETFEVGDWIVVEDCPCKRIIGKVQKRTEVEEHSTFTRLHYDRDWWSVISKSKIRHATPEVIEEEKQCRWWAKHGRDVWELRESD